MTNENDLLDAYLAGFRHSRMGYNGEFTPPGTPDPWDPELREGLRPSFEEWLREADVDRGISYRTLQRLQALDDERADLGIPFEEYICYVLEIDRDEVNEDGLAELTVVLARLGAYADAQRGDR